jgi:hypothetical protein
MLQTKFGDHPWIRSLEADVKRYFYFMLKRPLKGANQIDMSKFDKRLPKNATDNPSISSVEEDV